MKTLTLLLAIVFAAGTAPLKAEPPAIWFEDLTEARSIDGDELESLANRAWRALRDDVDAPQDRAASGDAPSIVILSASDGASRATTATGAAHSWVAAVDDAVRRLRGRLEDPGAIRWLRLDVAMQLGPRETRPARPFDFFTDSARGVAFEREFGVAFPPGAAEGRGVVNEDGSLDVHHVVDSIHDEAAAARLGAALRRREAAYFRFRARGAAVIDGDVHLLRNGHRRYDQTVSADDLLDAAALAGDYLTGAVKPDGLFVYIALPADPPPDDYNIVRHAGATYSLFQAYGATGDPATRAAAERALDRLLEDARPWSDEPGAPLVIVEEDGETALGTSGLAILSIAEQIRTTGEKKHLPAARRLAQWILDTQNEDGELTAHKADYRRRRIDEFRSRFYPGEAIFGLARLHQVDPDPRWRDAAASAARWLITVRDGDLADDELPADHWLLYGLNDLGKIAPDPLWASQAAKICEVIRAQQHRDPEKAEWYGGFYDPPGSTSAATNVEGMSAAIELFRNVGDEAAASRTLETARLATRFMLQMQLRPEQTMYMDDPHRMLGGIHGGFDNWEVRNDYVQHAISALLGMRREEIAARED